MNPEQMAAFKAMFDEAVAGRPQVLHRGGQPVAVLISFGFWQDIAELVGADPYPFPDRERLAQVEDENVEAWLEDRDLAYEEVMTNDEGMEAGDR